MYFYHFNTRSGYATPNFVTHHPMKAVGYFIGAIGFTHVALGVVLLSVAIWVIATGLRRDGTSGSPIGVALVCFGLLFAASITYARGWQPIPASRYVLFDLLIPVGCYLALLGPSTRREVAGQPGARASAWAGRDSHLVVLALLICAMSFLVIFGTADGLTSAGAWNQDQLTTAQATVNIDKIDNTLVDREVYFPARTIRQLARIARTHHLSLFAASPVVVTSRRESTGPSAH